MSTIQKIIKFGLIYLAVLVVVVIVAISLKPSKVFKGVNTGFDPYQGYVKGKVYMSDDSSGMFPNNRPEDCKELCDTDDDCMVATYRSNGNSMCYLFNSFDPNNLQDGNDNDYTYKKK